MQQLYRDGPEMSYKWIKNEARLPETRQKQRRNEINLD